MLSSLIFCVIFIAGLLFFIRNIRKLVSNIQLGKSVKSDPNSFVQRLKMMIKYALGQSKMTMRPVSGVLHIIVYIGFIVVNIEVLEIILDGIFSTHRIFGFMGVFYNTLIAVFEIFAFFVIVSVVIFWVRRNVLNISRFEKKELEGSPKKDANFILYFEFILMLLFLLMNASDYKLQQLGQYAKVGYFPISTYFLSVLPNSVSSLILMERACWWLHIIGIMIFLNYLYYSKHLHIILSFPTTFYSSLGCKGELPNLPSVTKEVRIMMGESVPNQGDVLTEIQRFGVADVTDLSRVQIMSAYSCTECGRCTDSCPANQTGKRLSPRKIMMDIRHRADELGEVKLQNGGILKDDGKNLFSYIKEEELWACTTCNACVDACPININPMEVIVQMRQYLVMEQSKAPQGLLSMMNNIENNGAPWPYGCFDRTKWTEDFN